MKERASHLPGAVDEVRAERQAEMLAGRVKKTFRRLGPRFERERIGAFRVYDRDIPEVRAVVDWYEGHLVVGEYERRQTELAGDWLRIVALAAARALHVPEAFVHLKRRRTRPKVGARYPEAPPSRGPGRLSVREGDLRFRVNLDDYLDTGLFADQRQTRQKVRSVAGERSVLNLFAYTGTFSAAALAGGAKHVTSVELSRTYLDWLQTNLRENELPLTRHEPARRNVFDFLSEASRDGRRWDIVIADPPSYSTVGLHPERGGPAFDIRRDYAALLEAILPVVRKHGVLYFSSNHQRFDPDFSAWGEDVRETTEETVPLDYRNRRIHRSWEIRPSS